MLQRQTAAAVWGWDAPASEVAVTFRGDTIKTKADAGGKWLARIATGEAGGPFTLLIEGSRKIELGDVMVGEVWVAGGQSNMWWHVANCKNLAQEKAEATLPGVRIFDPTNTSDRQAGWPAAEPQRTVKAQWVVAAPETIGDFPGTAYFFAKQLHRPPRRPGGHRACGRAGHRHRDALEPQIRGRQSAADDRVARATEEDLRDRPPTV